MRKDKFKIDIASEMIKNLFCEATDVPVEEAIDELHSTAYLLDSIGMYSESNDVMNIITKFARDVSNNYTEILEQYEDGVTIDGTTRDGETKDGVTRRMPRLQQDFYDGQTLKMKDVDPDGSTEDGLTSKIKNESDGETLIKLPTKRQVRIRRISALIDKDKNTAKLSEEAEESLANIDINLSFDDLKLMNKLFEDD